MYDDDSAKKKAKAGFADLVRKAMASSMFGDEQAAAQSSDMPVEEKEEQLDPETLEKLKRLLSEG